MEKKSELNKPDVQKKSVEFRKVTEQNLQKKRLEIQKETEQLRAQLEELIGSNRAKQCVPTIPVSINTQDVRKVQVTNLCDHQLPTAPLSPSGVVSKETKTSIKKEAVPKRPPEDAHCPKKKNYNVEEAREYMKKRREKRLELMKFQKKETVTTRELKKKKIEEIQKKSLELVARNLETKRERSKSRDRQDSYVRPTSDLKTAFVGRQSRVMEKKDTIRTISNLHSTGKVPENENIQCDPLRNSQSENDAILKPCTVSSCQIIDQKVKPERNPNLLYPPDYSILQNIESNENFEDTLAEEPVQDEGPRLHTNNPQFSKDEEVRLNNNKPLKKINILSNVTIRPAKPVSQHKNNVPTWLQETPLNSDPFSFINIVKRKLNLALSPPTVDVAVQSSVIESLKLDHIELNTKDQPLSNTSSAKTKNTDLKSFISHKCLNLDTKTLEQLSLIPKKSASKKSTLVTSRPVSHTYTPTPCESESDTSKNIPSISSESGLSVRRNAERVRQLSTSNLIQVPSNLQISTENLDNMKLKRSDARSSTRTIITDKCSSDSEGRTAEKSKQYSYSSDFLTDLSKRKDSIIAYNCARVSPNKVGYVASEKSVISARKDSIICGNSAKVSPNKVEFFSEEIGSKQSEELISVDTQTKIQTLNRNINISQNALSEHSSKTTNNADTVSEKSSKVSSMVESNAGNTNGSSKKTSSYKSLCTEFHESQTDDLVKPPYSKSESCLLVQDEKSNEKGVLKSISEQNLHTEKKSDAFSNVVSLKEPKVLLTIPKESADQNALRNNISVRSVDRAAGDKNSNQIHLKFEAEIHLLNDFNESLKHLTEVEKAFESLRSKNDTNITTRAVLQNRDTQTSVITRSAKTTLSDENRSQISSINYSRGSEINSQQSNTIMSDSKSILSNVTNRNKSKDRTSSILSVGNLQLSNTRDESLVQRNRNNNSSCCFGDFENLQSKNFAGLSLTMFDHLIRDEDARLENLKTMLKIREQALLDRTKAELAMLEIQKKHLKETGKLQEASLVKKKQRGILLKHQQERHEMQRLKQMQKAASVERKIILKEQRNLIKHQLYTDNMLSKIRVNTPRERRLSGPLKVIQTHNETVRSETSISKKVSAESEVQSVTSHTTCSVMSVLSEDARSEGDMGELSKKNESRKTEVAASQMKRTLLMREDELKKRNKAVQELLQWHNKLLEEEKRIAELESTANIIISQTPNNTTGAEDNEKYKFKGKQLNQLWLNLTGCDDKKFVDDRVYPMSQIALERFCKSARECCLKSKKIPSKILSSSDNSNIQTDDSISDIGAVNSPRNIPEKQDSFVISLIKVDTQQNLPETSDNNEIATVASQSYSLDFDVETVSEGAREMDVLDQSKSKISSISELIDNFSKIKDEISTLSAVQSKKISASDLENNRVNKRDEHSPRTDRSASDISSVEPSVIDTASSEQKVDKVSEHITPSSHSIAQSTEVSTEKTKDNSAAIFIQKTSTTDKENTLSGITEDIINEEPVQITEDKTVPSTKHSNRENLTKDSDTYVSSAVVSSEHLIEEIDKPEQSSEETLKSPSVTSSKHVIKEIDKSEQSSEETLKSSANERQLSSSSIVPEETKSPKSITEDTPNLKQHTTPSVVFSVPSQEDNRSKDENTSDISGIPTDQTIQGRVEENFVSKSAEENVSSHPEGSEAVKTDSDEIKSISKTELATKPLSKEKSRHQEESVNTEPIQKDIEDVGSPESSFSGKEKIHPVQPSQTDFINIIQLPSDTDRSPRIESPTNEYSTDFTSADEYKVESPKPDHEDLDITNERSSVTIEEIHSPSSKEDINSCEEKEHDSLSTSSSGSSRSPPVTERIESQEKSSVSLDASFKKGAEISAAAIETANSNQSEDDEDNAVKSNHSNKSLVDEEEKSSSSKSKSSSPSGEKSPRSSVDVLKRVSEILAESTPSPRGDRSPRLQDLYQTTYDLVSPTNSPDLVSPLEERKPFTLGSEAEELLKKQLAIEQEIKQITEQQQKQQLPYIYVREIPNKPPPPYTPPSSISSPSVISIVPTKQEEIDEITKYSAKIIHKAYVSNNLENISMSDNTLNLIAKDINKDCYKFVFDLCKELAKEHYKQFESETVPSWLQVTQKQKLAVVKPLDVKGLEKYMNKKLAQLFNFQKVKIRENTIIKWSRKKRDHVDEILVMESQAEELQWTNFDKDELEIKNNVTNDIMKMLLQESVEAVKEALSKKSYLY